MPEIQFSSISDFLSMGGYGLYVWSSYGIFSLMVVLSLMLPRFARKKIIKQQLARLQREQARKEGV